MKQSISIHSIGENKEHLKLIQLNEKRNLFKNFKKIKQALNDILDSLKTGEDIEEGIVFIIADYADINMYLKQIHKSVPSIVRTRFVKPKFVRISQLKKYYEHYLRLYSDAYQTIENHQEYQVAVRYPVKSEIQTVNQKKIIILKEQYNDCGRCAKTYMSRGCEYYGNCDCNCHGKYMMDEDCKGGIVTVIETKLKSVFDKKIIEKSVTTHMMCRTEKNGLYTCYCNDN